MVDIHDRESCSIEDNGPHCSTGFAPQELFCLIKCQPHPFDSLEDEDHSEPLPDSSTQPNDDTESSLCAHCENASNKCAQDFITTEHEDHPYWNDIIELEKCGASGRSACFQFLQIRENIDHDQAKERIQRLGPTRNHGTKTFYGKNDQSLGKEPCVILRFMKSALVEQNKIQGSGEESDDVMCHYAVDDIRLDSPGRAHRFLVSIIADFRSEDPDRYITEENVGIALDG